MSDRIPDPNKPKDFKPDFKPGGLGRWYEGYEDDSPSGRAAIDAFNKAGGPDHLGPKGDPAKYAAAVTAAEQARAASQRMDSLKSQLSATLGFGKKQQ